MKITKGSAVRCRQDAGQLCFAFFLLVLTACATQTAQFSAAEPLSVRLIFDGESIQITSNASNVRELLDHEAIELSDDDLIDPPLFTPLTAEIEVKIVRVTESIEIIEKSIPFQRRTVRNESMSAEDDPLIVQAGHPGLQETTVRIVYYDGIESSRQETKVTIVESAQDEIVMMGTGLSPGNVDFAGLLAFISGGNSVLLRGSSAFPEQLNTGGDLDHRVFSLSPDGNHLLYTRISTDTERFNTLWVVGTEPDSAPRQLDVENILWADWNPALADNQQIAFTTGIPTDLLPGWEANNDLWVGDISASEFDNFRPMRLIEAYPATYGWWGGNYAWSPNGDFIAYSFADEVGIIDLQTSKEVQRRAKLQSFTEFNTRADWVWVPTLSWSPDGEFLVFSKHIGNNPDDLTFDTWVASISTELAHPFVQQTGIWSHPRWSPAAIIDGEESGISEIAFLRATNPLESQQSTYTLWRMDRDGSDPRQIYPPAGENSRFPHDQSFMSWGPSGREIAFTYNSQLYLIDLDLGEAKRLTIGDSPVTNPTWAPYGNARLQALEEKPAPTEEATPAFIHGVTPFE